MGILLTDLLTDLGPPWPESLPQVEVAGVTDDSREVAPGWVFVAIQGEHQDGHRFVADAFQKGAAAVVGQSDVPNTVGPYLRVANSRQALARLAAAWHGHPGRSMVVIGVTGTDGKTTTASLIHSILTQAGLRAGLVSTVEARMGDQTVDTGLHVTTPEPMALQGYLKTMVEAGLTHVVLESTSHGLAQHRVDGSEFDVAVVTNITHEHLDFHGSYEAYRAAKARLLELVAQSAAKPYGVSKAAVINLDDPGTAGLQIPPNLRRWTYALEAPADVWGDQREDRVDGLRFQLHAGEVSYLVRLGIVGDYNAWNALAAFACCVKVLGIEPEVAVQGLGGLHAVPGRMEKIDLGQPFAALVDFAHTPNALRQALTAARSMSHGRLIVVFGSAGLRDRQKRRLMAEASAELADLTVLTAEDPRTEALSAILAEMAQAAAAAGAREGETMWRIPDRGQAIREALQLARPGDLVLACGKGHEQSMCFGETEYAWDDRTALRAALAERLGLSGPNMPELPTSAGPVAEIVRGLRA
jgi:UDP-N-acetylmuramoyl-L-alanyl-D-glutamate--2,6-diaminopimelate ligase